MIACYPLRAASLHERSVNGPRIHTRATMAIPLCRRTSRFPQFRRRFLRSCPTTSAWCFQRGYLVRLLSPWAPLSRTMCPSVGHHSSPLRSSLADTRTSDLIVLPSTSTGPTPTRESPARILSMAKQIMHRNLQSPILLFDIFRWRFGLTIGS